MLEIQGCIISLLKKILIRNNKIVVKHVFGYFFVYIYLCLADLFFIYFSDLLPRARDFSPIPFTLTTSNAASESGYFVRAVPTNAAQPNK